MEKFINGGRKGRHELAQMITERESVGQQLQLILDARTKSWGITIQSVEIREVRILQALEKRHAAAGPRGRQSSFH